MINKFGNVMIMFALLVVYGVLDVMLFSDYFYVVFVVQLFFIYLSLSRYGSFILRCFYSVSRVKTERDKSIINRAFYDVEDNVKMLVKEDFFYHIKVYIDNDMSVNAYAINSNTIVVTRGAMKQLTNEQLKAIIAHEFCHILRWDTYIMPFLLIGNFIFFFFILIAFIVEKILNFVSECILHDKLSKAVISCFKIIVTALSSVVLFTVTIILAFNQRHNEYVADEFSAKLGYKKELIDTLYELRELDFSKSSGIFSQLKANHPNLDDRIERLEKLK